MTTITSENLDLLLAGSTILPWASPASLARIYRHDAGRFVDAGTALPDLLWSHASWADYDKDGDLDLLSIGVDSRAPAFPSNAKIQLWRNEGGHFLKVVSNLPALTFGTAAWGDIDANGDLDVVLCFSTSGSGTQI